MVSRLRILLYCILICSNAAHCLSEDRVILQPEKQSSRISLPCTILDYTREKITVRTRTGSVVKDYPASQVVQVQTYQTPAQLAGLKLFSTGQVVEAQDKFREALKDENRAWVRREILSLLIRCALHQNNQATAGTRFLALLRSESDTRFFHLIPLVWSPTELSPAMENQAKLWLSDSDATARLLGASFLLKHGEYGVVAEAELKQLSADIDRRVHRLARAQLWRVRLVSENFNNLEPARWKNRIESMPAELRGGPYYILGRAYRQLGEHDRAAAAFLWLPCVYSQNHNLAARACLEAADSLSQIGQRDAAITLYLEVTERFSKTSYAQEALMLLKSLAQESK